MFGVIERQYYESGNEGTIVSPNYPNDYDIKKDYYWRITVPEGKRIEIRFDTLDLEDSKNCGKDSLSIYDGISTRYVLLGTYCGNTRPNSFRSSGRYLFLHFRSDGDVTGKGFRLYWKAVGVVVQPEG